MESRDLDSWEQFAKCIRDVRSEYGVREWADGSRHTNQILFRGQANSTWDLLTTLERRTRKKFTVDGYSLRAHRCLNEIASLTGKRWDVPDWPEVKRQIKDRQSEYRPHLPAYDYLVYLRHHGFPSPLLDWTASPYVAAYFAYAGSARSKRVAVYAYIGTPNGSKSWFGNPPMIHVMGPYVTTDVRHFTQKAWYTVATQYSEDEGRHVFRPHAEVFDNNDSDQDVLIKITMPSSERRAALKELEDYNINAFTLFQTEDALVETMAVRQFELDDA